jgi:hypothetical protein
VDAMGFDLGFSAVNTRNLADGALTTRCLGVELDAVEEVRFTPARWAFIVIPIVIAACCARELHELLIQSATYMRGQRSSTRRCIPFEPEWRL